MAVCPECEAPLDIKADEIEEGRVFDCPECGAELEVVSTHPTVLDVIEKDEGEEEDEI